jgi:hypothetical protein
MKEVRDATAKILDHTTLARLNASCGTPRARRRNPSDDPPLRRVRRPFTAAGSAAPLVAVPGVEAVLQGRWTAVREFSIDLVE